MLCRVDTGSFPGTKRPARGGDHSLSSNTEVANRLEVYLRFPLSTCIGMSWNDLYLYSGWLIMMHSVRHISDDIIGTVTLSVREMYVLYECMYVCFVCFACKYVCFVCIIVRMYV